MGRRDMRWLGGGHAWWVSVALMAVMGCTATPARPAAPPESVAPAPSPVAAAGPKRLTAAINARPTALSSNLTLSQPGTTELDALVHGGTAVPDDKGVLHPQLA